MVTSAEKTNLYEQLAQAFDEFIATLSFFNEDEINRVPFTNSWTPAQVAVHIMLATDGVPDRNSKVSDRAYDACLPKIRPWWQDLNQKFTSPEPLRPENRSHNKQELLSELRRCRDKDLLIISEKNLTDSCLDLELPTIGLLTRYEWLWFIEMHLRRHIFQLKNMQHSNIWK